MITKPDKNFVTDTIKCPHRFECQGCQSWDTNYFEQLEHKKNDLKTKLGNTDLTIHVKTAGSARLRTRFDFTVENQAVHQKVGLYGKSKELIDLSTCFQLDPDLNIAFQELKKIKWPFKKGSLRLRISPTQKLGLWLDLANIDIKNMLIEKTFLIELSKTYFIEIGQKKKTLDLNSFNQQQLKLADPKLQVWFQTQNQLLQSYVSSFTQPTWLTADLITENILNWMNELGLQKSGLNNEIVEYGCGIGQFTVPLLEKNDHISVFENDLLALEALKINAKEKLKNLRINQPIEDKKIDFALVNPPRSGLKDFKKTIMLHRPKNIIYISCYPESMAEDLLVLFTEYKMTKIEMIDQFPQTLHYEVMILLQRID
jgi:23S rRNA (uracil1939-C5)-methyltransferase